MTCVVTSQILRPHRCAGLVVLAHMESTSRSAYLSAAALTEKALQKANPVLPFFGPSCGLLQDTYAALQAAYSDLPALSLDAVVNDIPALQTMVRRAQEDKVMLQILKSMCQEQCNSESTAERMGGEQNIAKMYSVMDSGASKFMDVMPFVIYTQMNDQQYRSGVWNYLGLSVGPVNPGSLRCQWGLFMTEPDHLHSCMHLSGAIVGRKDFCENAWYRGVQRAGMSASKQPKNLHLQMQGHTPLSGTSGYRNSGDLLRASLTRMVELDVTFVHTTGTAGRTQGARKEASKSVKMREAT